MIISQQHKDNISFVTYWKKHGIRCKICQLVLKLDYVLIKTGFSDNLTCHYSSNLIRLLLKKTRFRSAGAHGLN